MLDKYIFLPQKTKANYKESDNYSSNCQPDYSRKQSGQKSQKAENADKRD